MLSLLRNISGRWGFKERNEEGGGWQKKNLGFSKCVQFSQLALITVDPAVFDLASYYQISYSGVGIR